MHSAVKPCSLNLCRTNIPLPLHSPPLFLHHFRNEHGRKILLRTVSDELTTCLQVTVPEDSPEILILRILPMRTRIVWVIFEKNGHSLLHALLVQGHVLAAIKI